MRTKRATVALTLLLGLLLGGLSLMTAPAATAAVACNDGVDNDGDGYTDWPSDVGCTSSSDTSEVNPDCSDGVDNDGDGRTDYPTDTGCGNSSDTSESPDPQCSDGADNDGDGRTDYPSDTGCTSIRDNSESPNPQCDDGVDNDSDGNVDYPADPGCSDPTDTSESCTTTQPYAVCVSTGTERERLTIGNPVTGTTVKVAAYLDIYRFTVANTVVNVPCVNAGVNDSDVVTPSPCATLGGQFVSRTPLYQTTVNVPQLTGPTIATVGICNAELTATVLGAGISSAQIVTAC